MHNETDRRDFLKLIGSSALAAAAPPGLQPRARVPAHNRTGTIADVEHIVILMQENRSFDHYFGTMRGVRGFASASSRPVASAWTRARRRHRLEELVAV